MNKLITNYLIVFGLIASTTLSAQDRFKDKVFTDVKVTSNVTYGWNHTVLGWGGTPPLPVDSLKMDVYEPLNDTMGERPLIIMMHAGSFLPKGLNTLPFGNKNDSSLVEICKQFAQRGYVAAAINYRLGWNPLGNQEEKASTIINAVYKSMQDGKAAVRYFRKDAATANMFKIDPDKVVLGGSNSGGYAALAAGALDKSSELNLFKFLDGNGAPYVNTAIWGDFDGDNGTAGFAYYNHPGYDSDPQMILNMGGAMGDSSWIEAGEVPMISFHGVADALTPYNTAIVIVASTGDPIVEVSGSLDLSLRATRLGNQDWNEMSLTDAISVEARSRSAAYGLYPFPGAANGFEPWGWYSSSDPNTVQPPNGTGFGSAANPVASKPKALLYIDTIMGYFCPRAVNVLGLPGNTNPSSVDAPEAESFDLTIAPNPANEFVVLKSKAGLKTVQLFDITGKSVLTVQANNQNRVVIDRNNLPSGFYLINAEVGETTVIQKLILK
jgi:acetyl esterase/lipase